MGAEGEEAGVLLQSEMRALSLHGSEASEESLTGDPRFTLTDEEHYHVMRLKEACDAGGVEYKSIFELAKYSFVCSSVKNEDKRLKDSFGRLKKRREFERKHKLDTFDIWESLEVLEKGMPNWVQNCGMLNGKWVIGYDGTDVDGKYLARTSQGLEHLCIVELTRFDYAAADLEEARQGFYIVSSGKTLKGNPLNHARMMVKLRVLFDKMNANRVKGIFYAAPGSLSWLFSSVLKILPKKISQRVKVAGRFESMELEGNKLELETFSTRLGGKFDMTTKQWLEMRQAHYTRAELEVEL